MANFQEAYLEGKYKDPYTFLAFQVVLSLADSFKRALNAYFRDPSQENKKRVNQAYYRLVAHPLSSTISVDWDKACYQLLVKKGKEVNRRWLKQAKNKTKKGKKHE